MHRSNHFLLLCVLALSGCLFNNAAADNEVLNCDQLYEKLANQDKHIRETQKQIHDITKKIETARNQRNDIAKSYFKCLVKDCQDRAFFERQINYADNQIHTWENSYRTVTQELSTQFSHRNNITVSLEARKCTGNGIVYLDANVTKDETKEPYKGNISHFYKRKEGVTVIYSDTAGNDTTFEWSIQGIPDSLREGDTFEVNVSGTPSGTCYSAGGCSNTTWLKVGSGFNILEKSDDIKRGTSKITIGVSRHGHKPKAWQDITRSGKFRIQYTGKKGGTIEFKVNYQAGYLMVTKYEWKP